MPSVPSGPERGDAALVRLFTAALCSGYEVKLRPTAGLYIIQPQSLNKAEGPPTDEKKKKSDVHAARPHPPAPVQASSLSAPADVIHAQFPAARQRL